MPRRLCISGYWVGVAIGIYVRAQVCKPGYCLYCLIVNMDCSWSNSSSTVYRVGQIKRGQLTFLLVTSERTYKIECFLAGVNYIDQLEINMHHLRDNAIPAGPVQYPLSNSDEIWCR